MKKFSFDIIQASAALVEIFPFTDVKDNWRRSWGQRKETEHPGKRITCADSKSGIQRAVQGEDRPVCSRLRRWAVARPRKNVYAMLNMVYCPNNNRSPLKDFQTKGRSRVWRVVDGLIRVSKKSLWLQWER